VLDKRGRAIRCRAACPARRAAATSFCRDWRAMAVYRRAAAAQMASELHALSSSAILLHQRRPPAPPCVLDWPIRADVHGGARDGGDVERVFGVRTGRCAQLDYRAIVTLYRTSPDEGRRPPAAGDVCVGEGLRTSLMLTRDAAKWRAARNQRHRYYRARAGRDIKVEIQVGSDSWQAGDVDLGGTGRFDRATGALSAFGAADLGRGQTVFRYSGEVCLKPPIKS
jgi:hypothetical protein